MGYQKALSQEAAARVWNAHREINVATKLRDEMATAIKDGEDPTPRDTFGRRANLTLGVPSGGGGERLYNVDPQLAIHILDGHIASKTKELVEASIAARIELTA